MASRMERYENEKIRSSRSSRNKNLYDTITNFGNYSNIEGVVDIDKDKNIDISKVKEMIDKKENNQYKREYRNSTEEPASMPFIRKTYKRDENRSYDVMDVLKEAKEKKEPDNKERVLNTTNYDILKKINIKSKSEVENPKEEDLKELIETISNTSMINKNDDTSLNMFGDLASDDTKVGELKDIRELMDEREKERLEKDNEKTMDDSFFTTGIRLKRADFTDGGQEKKPKVWLWILVLIVLLAAVVFLLNHFGIIHVFK